jgi:hypothetical protein
MKQESYFYTATMGEETLLHYKMKPYITIRTCYLQNTVEFQGIAAKKNLPHIFSSIQSDNNSYSTFKTSITVVASHALQEAYERM